MRQRSRFVLLMAAFALVPLLIPGLGAARAPQLAAATDCIYLPMVSLTDENREVPPSLTSPSALAAGGGCQPAAPAPAPPAATATASATTTATTSPTASATATVTTSPTATATATSEPAQVAGTLRLRPEYVDRSAGLRVPRYLVVLDASGSMSASFNGQCNNTGPVVQCANGPAGFPAVQVTNTGPYYYWKTETERRIYVAKKAVERLLSQLSLPGNPGYDSARPTEQMAVVWFNEGTPSSNALMFSSDVTTITNFVANANKTSGDSYRTAGGTNGAAGLFRAQLLLAAAPHTVDFGGQTYTYENHVIFITDGVSNQFLDINAANLSGGQSSASTYPSGSYCRSLGSNVIENAMCQITEGAASGAYDGKYNGWDRPITQMIDVSQNYLRSGANGPTDVSVLALSNVPTTGLRDGVPSSTNRFYQAEGLEIYADGTTNVDALIDAFYSHTRPAVTTCQPAASAWTDQIDPAHLPEGVAELGQVALTSASDGAIYSAPIERDPATGQLSYGFAGLPAGSYELQAYLFYKGDDGATRVYSLIDTPGGTVSALTVTLSGQSQSLDPVSLRLSGDLCAL